MAQGPGAGLLGCETSLATEYDLALVDLDGTAYRGKDPIENAATGLTAARNDGMALCFVTNNASRSPDEVAEQLTDLGIPATVDEVLTSSQACADLLKTRLAPGAKVLVVGGAGLRTEVSKAGFTIVHSADDQPEAVAQGFAADLGWSDLAEAAYAIENGAWYVASNLDRSLPTERGFAPGNGSLVLAVEAASGVKATSIGKPDPAMYQMAAQHAGARRPLAVGDRLDTDLAGARAADYPGLLVLTGVSTARDVVLAPPQVRPNYLGADLLALVSAHPQPVPTGDGWWECNGRRARVDDGKLSLDEQGPHGLDVIRAACAASWAATDAGDPVDPASVPEFSLAADRP